MLIRKYFFHLALVLLVFAVIAGNFFWLKSTGMMIPFASAEAGLNLYINATEGVNNLFEGISSIIRALAGYNYCPPLHQLLIMFYHFIFGPEKFVPMALNATFLIIAVFSVYMLCKKASGPKSGLLAAFITITSPAIFIMARTDLTEYALFSWVALTLYLFVYTQNFYSRKYSIFLGIALGLGMLLKWTYAGYIGGIFLVSILPIFVKGLKKEQLRNLILAVLIVTMIAAVWYVGYLDVGFFLSAIGNEASDLSLHRRILFFANTLRQYISLPYVVMLVIGALVLIANIKRVGTVFFILLMAIVMPYVVFSSIPHIEPRYFLPVIPTVSCLISLGVFTISNRFARRVLVFAVVFIGLFNLIVYFETLPIWGGQLGNIPLAKLQYESKMFDNIMQAINDDLNESDICIAISPFIEHNNPYVSIKYITYRLTLDHLKHRNTNIYVKGFELSDFKKFPYEIDDVDFLIVTRRALKDDENSDWMRICTRKFVKPNNHNIKELYLDDPSYRKLIMDNFALLKEYPSSLGSNVLIYENKKRISDKL